MYGSIHDPHPQPPSALLRTGSLPMLGAGSRYQADGSPGAHGVLPYLTEIGAIKCPFPILAAGVVLGRPNRLDHRLSETLNRADPTTMSTGSWSASIPALEVEVQFRRHNLRLVRISGPIQESSHLLLPRPESDHARNGSSGRPGTRCMTSGSAQSVDRCMVSSFSVAPALNHLCTTVVGVFARRFGASASLDVSVVEEPGRITDMDYTRAAGGCHTEQRTQRNNLIAARRAP
jgi:hypothetical protein